MSLIIRSGSKVIRLSLVSLYENSVQVWHRLRITADGAPRKPFSRYKVYDGETVLNSIDRIPFLRQFIWHYDEFARIHGPVYDGRAVNGYIGEYALKKGGPVTIEVINKLLRIAREKGDL